MNYKAHLCIKYIGLLIIVFFFISCAVEKETESTPSENTSSEAGYQSTYQPDYVTDHATELVAVVITASDCGWICDSSETKSTIAQAIDQLQLKADSLRIGFMTIGVSLDWVLDDGVNHLNSITSFDEIIVGNNWFNTGGLKYIFDEMQGSPQVPQFVLTKRTYEASVDSSGMIMGLPSGVRSEEVLVRQLFVNDLKDWLEEGLPIPEL